MATRKKNIASVRLNKPFYVESGPEDFDPNFTSLYRIVKGPLKSATPERFQKDWEAVIKAEVETSSYIDLDEAWSFMYEKGWDFEETSPRLSLSVPANPWKA